MSRKTLKDLFEVYRPKSPDEQKFVDKHVTIKHKDRNGNGDDVFKGNTKYNKRKEERHGYDVGEDEKVYEEVEFVDEAAEDDHFEKQSPKMQNAINLHLRKGKSYKEAVAAAQKHVKEEVEEVEEGASRNFASAIKKAEASRQRGIKRAARDVKRGSSVETAIRDHDLFPKDAAAIRKHAGLEEEVEEIEEKKLTPAEMKKREEIAKAMERENPGMDKSKKMAIATATAKRVAEAVAPETQAAWDKHAAKKFTDEELPGRGAKMKYAKIAGKTKSMAIATAAAKKVAEEVEELDELSKEKLLSYLDAASDARRQRNTPTAKLDKRYKSTLRAGDKINKGFSRVHATEEVEELDELSKSTLGSYAKRAMKDAPEKDRMGKAFSDMAAYDAKRGEREGASYYGKRAAQSYTKAANRRAGVEKAIDKLTKEEIINRAIDKYMPELEDYVPMTQEEKLVAKIEHLPEAHIHTLLSLYHSLNEDNRTKMMCAVDTEEGVNGLIDFAIQNRGE